MELDVTTTDSGHDVSGGCVKGARSRPVARPARMLSFGVAATTQLSVRLVCGRGDAVSRLPLIRGDRLNPSRRAPDACPTFSFRSPRE